MAVRPAPLGGPRAWDVDFTNPPAYAVSLRLPVSVLAGMLARQAAGGQGGRRGAGAEGVTTLAVDGAGRAVSVVAPARVTRRRVGTL